MLITSCLDEINSKDYSEQVIKRMKEKFSAARIKEMSEQVKLFVAVEHKKIVGVGGLKEDEVRAVFVSPESIGRGVGRCLMERIEQEAKNKYIHLLKVPSSVTARDFYKHLGYKVEKNQVHKKFGKCIIMTKELD